MLLSSSLRMRDMWSFSTSLSFTTCESPARSASMLISSCRCQPVIQPSQRVGMLALSHQVACLTGVGLLLTYGEGVPELIPFRRAEGNSPAVGEEFKHADC